MKKNLKFFLFSALIAVNSLNFAGAEVRIEKFEVRDLLSCCDTDEMRKECVNLIVLLLRNFGMSM